MCVAMFSMCVALCSTELQCLQCVALLPVLVVRLLHSSTGSEVVAFVVQWAEVRYREVPYTAVWCSTASVVVVCVFLCFAMYCSELQCGTVFCMVLQCVCAFDFMSMCDS